MLELKLSVKIQTVISTTKGYTMKVRKESAKEVSVRLRVILVLFAGNGNTVKPLNWRISRKPGFKFSITRFSSFPPSLRDPSASPSLPLRQSLCPCLSSFLLPSYTFPKIFTATFEHISGWFYRPNFGCCMCSAWRFIRCFSMFSSSLKWRFYFMLFLGAVPVVALGTFPSWEDCSYLEGSF